MKRLMIWVMVVTLMVGFFGLAGFAAKKVTLTLIMPSHESDILGYFEAKAVEFEKKTGIKVNMVTGDWDNVADKVLPALAAGSSAYDIVEFDNCWVAQFAETGWLRPLENYPGAQVYIDGLSPALVDLFSSKGHFYGITWNNDLRVAMYNARMLKEAGIAAPPATWDELVSQSQRLQAAGIVRYGYMANWEKTQCLSNDYTLMVRSFGGRTLDENGNPVMDSPQAIAALQWMVDSIYKYKVVDPASLTTNQQMAQDIFLRGDSAFFPQAWAGLYFYSRNPEVSNVVGEIEPAPKSLGVTRDIQTGLTLPEALAISSFSEHPDEAWAFLDFIANKQTNKMQSLATGSLPIWMDLWNDPDLLARNPHWKEYAKQIPYLEGLDVVIWYGELAEIMQVEVMNALTRAKTVEQAVADMIAKINAVEK